MSNIKCLLILLVNTMLVSSDYNAADNVSILLADEVNDIPAVFLKRQRRYLIFEKGATVVFQGNIGKSIIAGNPRGLNQISEYSLAYDLPSSIEMPRPKKVLRKPVTTTHKPLHHLASSSSSVGHHYMPPQYLPHSRIFDRKKQFHTKPLRKVWQCTNENVYTNYYAPINYDEEEEEVVKTPWCKVTNKSRRPQLYRARRIRAENRQEKSVTPNRTDRTESIFFDLIGKWAEMHGYDARYCIMRTLCESQHLLLPHGYLLFHDLVRILLKAALPSARRHAAFSRSIWRANPNECSQLYGPHCRVSLLEHFTTAMHGKFM